MVNNSIDKSNRNGTGQGMHPNSRKNLEKGREGNNHANKDCSITRIQREMMGELCPYAQDPTWTWAYTLAVAGMRDALTDERARENIKDRIEGKVAVPTSFSGTVTLRVKYDDDRNISRD